MDAAGIAPSDTVVEIGPGLGALTFALARTGARVIALEADRALAGALKERLGRKFLERVEVIPGDALRLDLSEFGQSLVVVGNLPYQISSPLIFKLLEAGPTVDRAVLTLQKELAERIQSPPGPKAYGVISVMVQLQAKVTEVMDLPPGAFFPVPQVASRTIRLDLNQPPPEPLDDKAEFRLLVRAAFNQRRKTLRQALLKAPLGFSREVLEEVLVKAGIDPGLRAERLSVGDYIRLANAAAGSRDRDQGPGEGRPQPA